MTLAWAQESSRLFSLPNQNHLSLEEVEVLSILATSTVGSPRLVLQTPSHHLKGDSQPQEASQAHRLMEAVDVQWLTTPPS